MFQLLTCLRELNCALTFGHHVEVAGSSRYVRSLRRAGIEVLTGERPLDRLRRALVAFRKRLAAAVSEDFGNRSVHETYAELMSSCQGIRYARRHLRGWMKPSKRRAGLLMATTKSRVYYQPKGIAGIIVPWNYPLALSIGPLTSIPSSPTTASAVPSSGQYPIKSA